MTESHGSVEPARTRRLGIAVIAGLAVLTIIRLLGAASIELLPEEAYYWTYFKHPALSYFDHPPMVAWCIGIGTTLFGDTEFGVRVVTILLSVASSWLVYGVAKMWFGQVPALWSVILFSALPIYIGTGVVAFPDGPLIFFWLLALCGTSQALTGGRNIGWLWAGLGFGGALLSKYTAVMFAPSLLLLLLVSPSYRHWLRRPQPWLALGLGLALFTPVIIWNSQNEWASFLFQSTRTNDARNISLRNVGIFWLYQLAILTPPVLALFARNIVKMWRVRDAASKFALAFGAPFFLLFVAASFKTQVHVNWTAPAFLALIPSAAALVVDRFARSRAWRMAGWVTGAMVTAFFVFGLTSLMWGQPRIFAASRVGGWRVLAVEVERVEQALEAHTGQRAFILGADRYNLAAELSFYTREPEEQVNAFVIGWQGLGFKYWTDLSALEGHPAVAVLTPKYYDAALSQLRVHFARVDEPRRYEAPSLGKRKRVVYLVNCYGYRTKPEPAPAASSSPAR